MNSMLISRDLCRLLAVGRLLHWKFCWFWLFLRDFHFLACQGHPESSPQKVEIKEVSERAVLTHPIYSPYISWKLLPLLKTFVWLDRFYIQPYSDTVKVFACFLAHISFPNSAVMLKLLKATFLPSKHSNWFVSPVLEWAWICISLWISQNKKEIEERQKRKVSFRLTSVCFCFFACLFFCFFVLFFTLPPSSSRCELLRITVRERHRTLKTKPTLWVCKTGKFFGAFPLNEVKVRGLCAQLLVQ